MNKIFIALALAVAMTPAMAGGNSNNNGPIFGGDTTNNYNTTNKGGQGGQGGTGVGVGVGVAKSNASAGAVAGASNSNKIGVGVNNKNTNFNAMSQSSALDNRNYNSDYNSNVNVAKGGSAHQGQAQGQDQAQGQSQSSKQANAQSMTYNEADSMHYSGEYTVKTPVGTAVAPSIDPTAPCAIPLTGAGQNFSVGLSIGTAYVDKGCEMRETVRLGLMGDEKSQNMANMVIRGQLQGYLDEQREEEMARVEKLKEENEGTGLVSVFELTNY